MTDNAIDEWLTSAIPPGSGRYYATLHAPDASKRRLQAIITLISVWSKLCFSNREIEVAQKKLNWWRDELQRDTSLHPVTRELQLALDARTATHTAQQRESIFKHLTGILEAYGTLLTSGSPATNIKNQEFHQRTGANTCLLLCDLPTKTENVLIISQAGTLLSRLRCLRYLHAHINNGLMCLPMTELETRNVKPNQFIPGGLPDNATQYLSDSIDTLSTEIQHLLNNLGNATFSSAELDGARTTYIYLTLQLRLLGAMQKNIDQLFLPEARLSPLRNYWYAFRAAARFEKVRLTE